MSFTVTNQVFGSEHEAVALMEARGLHALAADVEDGERGLHWHDFDAVIAVVSGGLTVVDVDGHELRCGPGALLEVTDRPLHTERTEAGRFVFGLPVPAGELERPINRDPVDHPTYSR